MFCTNCGNQISEESLFCPYCGKKTGPVKAEPEPEMTVPEPEKTAPKDEQTAASEPEMTIQEAEQTAAAEPEVTAPQPEEAVQEAEQAVHEQEQPAVMEPEQIGAAEPEVTAPQPEEPVQEAEQAVHEQEQTAAAESEVTVPESEEHAAQESDQPASGHIFCTSCGKPLREDSAFCVYCGTKVQSSGIKAGYESSEPAFTPGAEPVYTPQEESAYTPEPAKNPGTRGGSKKLMIIGAAALAVIACAVIIPLSIHNAKQKKYNQGVTYLEEGRYEDAREIFESLGKFDDSEKMAEFAVNEMEYLNIDDLAADGDYDSVIRILRDRSSFYGNSEEGNKATELADEYEKVSLAKAEMDAGNYESAAAAFEGLDLLKDKYEKDRLLCEAHVAEQNLDWDGILFALYAIQEYDPSGFNITPQTVENILNWDSDDPLEDYSELKDMIQTDDPEIRDLIDTAEKGYIYDAAKELLEGGYYQDAMSAFEELGDFYDSRQLYEQAKEGFESGEGVYAEAENYYYNGEYYKAKKLYETIMDYKDSAYKAASCVQSMPENGSLKYGNGSGVDLKIVVPKESNPVLMRIYETSGETVGQIFVHPGKSATVKMSQGIYQLKMASGSEWYGEKDLFGEGGSYQQLLDGSQSTFAFDKGYTYTITLGGVTNGNVGTKGVGGASGM